MSFAKPYAAILARMRVDISGNRPFFEADTENTEHVIRELLSIIEAQDRALEFASMPITSKPETWTVQKLRHTMENDEQRARETRAEVAERLGRLCE